MKKIILALAFLSLFASCEKIEDDSKVICTGDCTSISGNVYTHSNIPLKNVLLKFKFQKSGGQNLTLTRIISKEKTNGQGQYLMDFYLLDEEVASQIGSFSLYPDKNSIPGNVFYPEYFDLFTQIYHIPTRNVSLQKNLYIPTSKKLKIKLTNFHGIQQEDYFSVMGLIPCGFDNDQIDPQTGNNHSYAYNGLNKYQLIIPSNTSTKTFEVDFALNELNFILIRRMKNASFTEEVIPIHVDANTNQIFEYSY